MISRRHTYDQVEYALNIFPYVAPVPESEWTIVLVNMLLDGWMEGWLKDVVVLSSSTQPPPPVTQRNDGLPEVGDAPAEVPQHGPLPRAT